MEPGSGEASVPKKSRFCKYKQFATVTAHFNVGNLATRMIYFVRINNARRKSSDEYQGRRKFIRGEKKRKFVNRKKAGGKVYGPGMAD